MTRLAVVGTGGWGKNHVRVFCELLGTEQVIACDTDPIRRAAIETAHPGIATCDRVDPETIDAAVIATPAPTHFALARDALRSGLHVLVEKPIALRATEAEELLRLAEQSDRILMVDHLLEYHPAICKLRELVTSGTLGRVLHATSQRLNLGVIRSEENALWSLAPHDVSVLLFLIGEEPREIQASGEALLQKGIEDIVHVTMRFPSGALAHMHLSWLDPVKTRRLTIVGDRAMAVFEDGAEAPLLLYQHRIELSEGRYTVQRTDPEAVGFPRDEPLRSVAQAFLTSVETGEPPTADGRDGLRVVRVLERAQDALNGR